jgi:flagellar protein FliO/FliZ
MIKLIPFSRATVQVAILALGVALIASPCPASAYTPTGPKSNGESTPLKLTAPTTATHASSSGGAGIVRTIVGLAIVIAVIWGLSWILRQVKSGRETKAGGTGLASVATLPLGTGRSLHLVRAGADYLLLGSAEHGVVPIYRYTQAQAREAGLLNPDDPAEGAFGEAPPASGMTRTVSLKPSAPGIAGFMDRMRQMTVRQ